MGGGWEHSIGTTLHKHLISGHFKIVILKLQKNVDSVYFLVQVD